MPISNKQKTSVYFLLQNRRTGRQNRSCLEVWNQQKRVGRRWRRHRRVNMVGYSVLMYENGKMRPVETILGMGEEGG
jgi:hypothetical protein